MKKFTQQHVDAFADVRCPQFHNIYDSWSDRNLDLNTRSDHSRNATQSGHSDLLAIA
jgi:hypothetical protein